MDVLIMALIVGGFSLGATLFILAVAKMRKDEGDKTATRRPEDKRRR